MHEEHQFDGSVRYRLFSTHKNSQQTVPDTALAFSAEVERNTDVQIGDSVDLGGDAQGFLKFKKTYSGVKIFGLSCDIGSAVPTEDFRIYVVGDLNTPVLSLKMRIREAYSCIVEGDTLKVFVTKGLSRKNVSKVPIAVVNLKQLVAKQVEQSDADQPTAVQQAKPEGEQRSKPELEGALSSGRQGSKVRQK